MVAPVSTRSYPRDELLELEELELDESELEDETLDELTLDELTDEEELLFDEDDAEEAAGPLLPPWMLSRAQPARPAIKKEQNRQTEPMIDPKGLFFI
jgi:hypothetical protein